MAHSPTETGREHFGWADGLRGLAALAVLSYEALKHAPNPHWANPLVARAALVPAHGFDALLVLSGLLLAYPTLKTLRSEGKAKLNLAAFAVARGARILPLYFLVLALTVLVPLAAEFYGIGGLSDHGPSAHDAGLQAVFAGAGLGNDGLRAVEIQVRLLAIFPLLLGIYAFAPATFAPLAAFALVVEYAVPGLRWDVGALPALMLGILAADVLARGLRVERFAWPVAVLAAAGAFSLDPTLATLPGPLADRSFLVWNPLWAVAAAALALACAQRPQADRILAARGFRQLAGMSYAVILLAGPISATASAHAARSAGALLPLSVAAVSVAAAFALCLVLDRAAGSAAPARSQLIAAVSAMGDGALMSYGASPPGRRPPVAASLPATLRETFGPLPTMQPGMLASVVQRIGSLDDLRAEIEAVTHRLADAAASAAFYELPGFVTVPEQLALTRESFAYANQAGATERVEGVLLPPVEVVAAPRTLITLGAGRPLRPTVRLSFGPGFEGAHAS